jgi:hypothetical protein
MNSIRSKKWLTALAGATMMAVVSGSAEASSITFSNSAGQSGGNMVVGNTVQIGDGSGSGSAGDGAISAVDALPGNFSNITGSCGTATGTLGCLELSTGAFVGADLSTGTNDYLYSGVGSYIRIYGDAIADGSDSVRLLYSATFDSNVRLAFDSNCPGNCSGSLTGTVDGGTLDAFLATYLGVSATTNDGNATTLSLFFRGLYNPTSGPPVGSALVNTNSVQTFDTEVPQVPEPASMLLVSAGLLGLAHVARRRKVAAA